MTKAHDHPTIRHGTAARTGRGIGRGLRLGLATAFFAGLAPATVPPALALDAEEMFADPALETRAREIGRQLRCLVCQNESIFDSNAGLARDLRVVVRERIDAGDSDADVIEFVADRYGDYVLLKPPVQGGTLVLWFAPLAFLGLGGLGVLAYHRRGARREALPLTEADRAQAQRLLKGE